MFSEAALGYCAIVIGVAPIAAGLPIPTARPAEGIVAMRLGWNLEPACVRHRVRRTEAVRMPVVHVSGGAKTVDDDGAADVSSLFKRPARPLDALVVLVDVVHSLVRRGRSTRRSLQVA